ncbi:MAG: YlxR family protein [Chloroflexi bacterium]|nr:YlxR family protein [Chloroflexota bacterium]
MPKGQAARPKHIPQRTCLGCRQVLAKRTLVRVVRTPDGVRTDKTGKAPGRGAYIHNRRICWERALKGETLDQALRTTLTEAERETLRQIGQGMPEDDS